ncbi:MULTISPECIES: Arm DNA-binding domain-containing protein [Aerosakkonema]|uniref:Arm DNA-binding domain-containing protein n=1 Tax=Aerosakkonema TaxID=1246629 RepID=UPI0035B82276
MPVSVGKNKNYLRLRWTYQGERYCLSLGMKDTKTKNRRQVQGIILQIEADIESGDFDISLEKYRPKKQQAVQEKLTCLNLFQKWLEFKSRFVDARTIEWYRLTEAKLRDAGDAIATISISHSPEPER